MQLMTNNFNKMVATDALLRKPYACKTFFGKRCPDLGFRGGSNGRVSVWQGHSYSMRKNVLCGLCCHLVACWLITRSALAGEVWPDEPIQPPPVLREHNRATWPGDLRAERERYRHGFWAATAVGYKHSTVLSGGLIASTGPGLFFVRRVDLDLYLGPLRALAPDARILPAHRPLVALERIDLRSAGGRARDDLLGTGFVLWPSDSDERFPDWDELVVGGRRYTYYAFQSPYTGWVSPFCDGIHGGTCRRKVPSPRTTMYGSEARLPRTFEEIARAWKI